MCSDVLFSVQNRVGIIELNRPQALHALNLGMCESMLDTLLQWQGDSHIHCVLLKHHDGRGFCAGGDIRAIADGAHGDYAAQFFNVEYQLNHLLFHYRKPVVALMNGVTMGGGVGISLPCKYRVATEFTRFAMPETGIGLFPDVGGGWYLPRLPDNMGTYMALTGQAVKGADCVALGLATHFVDSDKLQALESAILSSPELLVELLSIHQSHTAESSDELTALRCFSRRYLNGFDSKKMLTELATLDDDLAHSVLAQVNTKSPMSVLASMRALQLGRDAACFADEMQREFVLACNIAAYPDFAEGVRALIVDKDNQPRWQHQHLNEVPDSEMMALFENTRGLASWCPAYEVE